MTPISANPAVHRLVDPVLFGVEGLGLAILALLGLVPFVLVTVFLPLCVLIVVVPLLVASAGLLRSYVDWHRRWAARVLGSAVPTREPLRGNMFQRVRAIVMGPRLWRELGWTLVNSVAGTFLGILRVALILSLPWGIVLTVLWSSLGEGAFGPWLFHLLGAQAGWIVGLALFVIGVLVNPALRRAQALLIVRMVR